MIADAIVQSQPEKLAPLISEHQMLMANMSLNNEGIESILADCKKDQSIAKISGSGLGDCVIILNKKVKKFPRNDDQKKLGIQSLNTLTCTRGVTIESS